MTAPSALLTLIQALLFGGCLCFLLFAPFSNVLVKVCFGVGSFLWLVYNVLDRKKKFLRGVLPAHPVNRALAFFALAGLASVLLGHNPYQSQGVFFDKYLTYFFLYAIGMGLAARIASAPRCLSWILVTVALLFGIGGVHDLILYHRINAALAERLWSVFRHQIKFYAFPLYVTFYLPLCFYLFIGSRKRFLRASAACATALLSVCLFANASRIAFGAVLSSILLIAFLRSRRSALTVSAFCLLAVGAVLLIPQARVRMKTIPKPAEWSNRLPLYRSAWMIYRDNPLFGVGVGNFERSLHIPKYELPADYPVPRELNLHAHNTYLELAAEMGTIGLAAFLGVFAAFFIALRRRLTHTPAPQDTALLCGMAASILAVLIFGVGASIITVGLTVSSYFWLFFGLASGLLISKQ